MIFIIIFDFLKLFYFLVIFIIIFYKMMEHKLNLNSIIIMFITMILSSIISGMNMWVNNIKDVRIHLNDIYMGISMTGWMFLFYGLIYKNYSNIYIGLITILISVFLIRNQIFINQQQYLSSMIPHHSMAIFMSDKIKNKNIILDKELNKLVNNIIINQQDEIELMKNK